ncbi:hypothetical protein FRB93_005227 [Tulasnella sp. JGI-2019a]|nr:hypothetical protein FRB93_005227 [Tulasnella sp. JGI-2019a]
MGSFLRSLFQTNFDHIDVRQWAAILKLANLWSFKATKAYAMTVFDTGFVDEDNSDRLERAFACGVSKWYDQHMMQFVEGQNLSQRTRVGSSGEIVMLSFVASRNSSRVGLWTLWREATNIFLAFQRVLRPYNLPRWRVLQPLLPPSEPQSLDCLERLGLYREVGPEMLAEVLERDVNLIFL